jgi:hypothetical protein
MERDINVMSNPIANAPVDGKMIHKPETARRGRLLYCEKSRSRHGRSGGEGEWKCHEKPGEPRLTLFQRYLQSAFPQSWGTIIREHVSLTNRVKR